MRFAFEVIKKGTILERAEIEMQIPPLLLYCRECENEYLGEMDDLRCPVCLKEQFRVLQGREMVVRSIEGGLK